MKLSDDLLENSFPNKIYSPVIPVVTFNAHDLLMLSHLFSKKSDLKTGSPPSYANVLSEVRSFTDTKWKEKVGWAIW